MSNGGLDTTGNDPVTWLDQSEAAVAAFSTELARMQSAMRLAGREADSFTGNINGGLRQALGGMINDGKKLSDALRGVARNIADAAFAAATKPITEAVAGALAGGIKAVTSGIHPSGEGAAFSQGRVTAFARGGVVSQPVQFPMRGGTGVMGEAGPEAIMPLVRGTDGRLGVAATGGGATRPVTVNITVNTPDVAGFSRSQSQIAAQMGRLLARGQRNL